MNNMQRFTKLTGEIDSLYHEAAFRLGQSDSVMTVLYTLLGAEGQCDISEICTLTGMRKQTLNSALRKMEQDKLIYLKSSTGKSKTVFLTEFGFETAAESAGRLRAIEDKALKEWSQDEIDVFLSLAERFLCRFREQVEKLPKDQGKISVDLPSSQQE